MMTGSFTVLMGSLIFLMDSLTAFISTKGFVSTVTKSSAISMKFSQVRFGKIVPLHM